LQLGLRLGLGRHLSLMLDRVRRYIRMTRLALVRVCAIWTWDGCELNLGIRLGRDGAKLGG